MPNFLVGSILKIKENLVSKKPKIIQNKLQPLEIITFLMSVFYMQSVLTVAHHAAYRFPESTGRTVENPAVLWLVTGTILVGYNAYKEKRLGLLNTVSLTVLVTASVFWLSGLRANFFF